MYRHLLVPSDGTDISVENIGRDVAFARETGARITFFFANPDYSTSADGALMHTVSPSMFAEKAAGHARTILQRPRRRLGRLAFRASLRPASATVLRTRSSRPSHTRAVISSSWRHTVHGVSAGSCWGRKR